MATSGAMTTSNQYINYTISVTQNSQSVAGNTSNVTVSVRFYRTNTGYETYGSGTVYCKINGTTYSASVSSSQVITSSGIVLFTKTLNISHNTDGTKTLTCSAWISHSRFTSSEQSYSQTLTTIPRKSTLTVADGTLGTAQTLAVTRQSTSFSHTITYTCGSASGTICTKSTSTSISFTPPLSLASQNTTGTSVTITYKIETFNGSTSVGSNTYSKTCTIPASVKPSVSVSVSEASELNYGVYVQGVSRLNINVTATVSYGSAIASYKTTVDGKTYTSNSFTTETLKGKGSLAITTVVTDKRGRTATYNGTVNVLEYNPPTISASVYRCTSAGVADKQGSYARVKFTTAYTSLNSKNSLQVKILYKQKDGTSFTTLTNSTYQNGTFETSVFSAATSKSYDIQVIATDAVCSLVGATAPKAILSLGTISKFISLFKNVGIAVGKIFDSSKPNTVQIGWDIFDKYDTQIRNGVAAYESAGIDANTTLEHHVLTQTNTPSNTFHHVITYFYDSKTETSNRVQTAIPYKTPTATYHRYYLDGEWSAWMHEGLSAYPVGSYYMANNDTSPAVLFGGTWQRIEGRFLYGCATTGTIGATGTHTTGSGSSSLPYLNVAIWRRTA